MATDGKVSWPTLISGAALAFVVIGGGWTLFQTQFNYIEKDKENIRFELGRRESEIKTQIKIIQDELDRRRAEFLYTREFVQFEARVVSELAEMKKQLNALEQTRPTTGELGAVNKGLESTISRQEERLRAIELILNARPSAK